MQRLLTGVAILAFASGAALAQSNGNGGDNVGDNGGDKAGGNGKADRGVGAPVAAQDVPNAGNNKGNGNRGGPQTGLGGGPAAALASSPVGRGNGGGNGNDGGGNGRDKGEARQLERAIDSARGEIGRDARQVQRDVRRAAADRSDFRDVSPSRTLRDVRTVYDPRRGSLDGRRLASLVRGCPPGLAKKNNGCQPPGLARQNAASAYGYDYAPSLFGLNGYDRGRYFYDDGYLMRLAGNGGIAGYIPLLGGALSIGNSWPDQYQSYSLPDYYVDYYDLGQPDSYRFADNVIYQVNPQSSAIESIAALLTGDRFSVGQPVPSGYDVYNVPYAYRDRFYDTPDANYRYSDGYVYRVDPKTQLVAAAIDLLL